MSRQLTVTAETAETKPGKGKRTAFRVLANTLMVLGFMAPVFGIVLFVVHSFVPEEEVLDDIGSVMIIVSIPLLLLGSHFLDKGDEVR